MNICIAPIQIDDVCQRLALTVIYPQKDRNLLYGALRGIKRLSVNNEHPILKKIYEVRRPKCCGTSICTTFIFDRVSRCRI